MLNGDDPLPVLEREGRVDEVVSEFEERGADRNGDGHGQPADQREAGVLDQHPKTQLEVQPTGSHWAEAQEKAVPSALSGILGDLTRPGVRQWHAEFEDEQIVKGFEGSGITIRVRERSDA